MINVKFCHMVFATVAVTLVTATAGADDKIPDLIDAAINDADEDSALEYYERKLKGQKDGIYEYGDDLLLMCSTEFDTQSADSRNSALRKTKEGAISKIKDWCIAYNAGIKIAPTNDKQRILWTCLDSMAPGWKYPEWHFTGSARVVARDEDYERETYTTVVAVSKKAAEREAEKFVPHVSNDDVLRRVAVYFSRNDFGKFSAVEKKWLHLTLKNPERKFRHI